MEKVWLWRAIFINFSLCAGCCINLEIAPLEAFSKTEGDRSRALAVYEIARRRPKLRLISRFVTQCVANWVGAQNLLRMWVSEPNVIVCYLNEAYSCPWRVKEPDRNISASDYQRILPNQVTSQKSSLSKERFCALLLKILMCWSFYDCLNA